MNLQQKIPALLAWINSNQNKINDNTTIFNILEGDVLTQIYKAIDAQMSGDSVNVSKQRAVPINILRRVVDKLSTLYNDDPSRVTTNPTDSDLMNSYVENLGLNDQLGAVNESFNAYKYGVEEIYYNEHDRKIGVRSVQSNLFLPYGDDPSDKTKVTAMIKFMGTKEFEKGTGSYSSQELKKNQKEVSNVYHIYSDDQFISITEQGLIVKSDMIDNPDCMNPYGVIPFSYISKSKYLLLPKTDTDTIAMSTLIPLLMTEINFGMMFLANPIIYGVDLEVSNLKIAPLAFWSISSKGDTENQAKIDVLRPDMNIPNQSDWIMEQFAMWLETKNIRASRVGSTGGETISSGVALMIREMDTTEDRKKQAKHFQSFEADFWQRLSKVHNTLAMAGKITERKLFTNDFAVKVNFEPLKAIESRDAIYARTSQAYQSGLISRERALKLVFPDWTEQEISEELSKTTFSLIDSDSDTGE